MALKRLSLAAIIVLFVGANTHAQHLWWNLEGQNDATCPYGEVTVLATHHAMAAHPTFPIAEEAENIKSERASLTDVQEWLASQ